MFSRIGRINIVGIYMCIFAWPSALFVFVCFVLLFNCLVCCFCGVSVVWFDIIWICIELLFIWCGWYFCFAWLWVRRVFCVVYDFVFWFYVGLSVFLGFLFVCLWLMLVIAYTFTWFVFGFILAFVGLFGCFG